MRSTPAMVTERDIIFDSTCTCLIYISTDIGDHFGAGDTLFSSLLGFPSVKVVFVVFILEFDFDEMNK